MKIKKLFIPVIGALAVVAGVALGAGAIQADGPVCEVCPAQAQAQTEPGPVIEFDFAYTSRPEHGYVFTALSEPERACVTQTVAADLEAAVYVEVESIDPSSAPWEPVPDELVYRESGMATMHVETCVVMHGTSRVSISGD